MKKQNILFNPFIRIAGWQAFAVGLPIALVTSVIATYSNLAFDGVLDAHNVENIRLKTSLVFMVINLISTIAAMYFAGLIVSKQIRFADIAGTMTFARAPLLLTALASFLVTPIAPAEIMKNPAVIFSQPGFIIFILLTIPIMIWVIAWTYNAFKTSTGGRGGKLIVTFIIALLVAETLSKALIYLASQASLI